MSLPIKETPHLKGKSARIFIKNMLESENKPVPREDYLRAKKTYEDCVKAWGRDPMQD